MTRALTRRVPRPSNNPIMEATTQEEFEKLFGIAIAKAIDTQEVPVKEKHLRTLIIASYKEKGAGTFWINFIRLQIEGSPILSWKFCHVLHKLLNEGHKNCIADSLKYRSKINDLGKLWSHLKEGYGQLILTYCKLILTKLEFHHRVRNVYGFSASYEIPLRTQNINVSGNLQLSDEQLEALGQHDVNTWFQLCVEMLDYVEDILALQRSVFNSLDMSRATSMTTSGQCKLAPLIICIQEASLLYDYLVKMMFKLYAALPPDILVGHQDRFNNLFKTLKQFYYTSSNLQYFKYLVSIPTLPETPPNFLIESDLKSYVSPQVLLHSDTAEHDTTDSPPDNRSIASVPLVDLNNDNRENKQKVEESFAAELMEKDITINSLKRDLGDVKATLLNHQQQASQTAQKFQKQILELQKELLKEKSLVEQLDEENSHYRSQAEELQNEKNQNTVSRLEESERKAQLAAEKLKKMKDVYAKLREEHIESLKKLANVQKDFECTRKSAEDFASEKNDLEANQKALNEEKNHHASVVAEMQTSLESLSSKCKLFEDYYWRLFECICNQCFNLMCDTLDQFDNPAHLGVTCSPGECKVYEAV
uniref:ENTH domain-containing protein n=1 Tax=Romanomermis culicivorax TaxID=13658 RepID=A0A915JRL9_ROMCU